MATSQPSALTPEIMEQLGREWVFTSPEEIGHASIRKFALAIGDANPLYCDREYARGCKYGGVIAPPTLACETMQFLVGELAEDGGPVERPMLPLGSEIRGGNEYTLHRPVRPEDVLTARWRFDNIRERDARTGKLIILSSLISYQNQHGDMLATNRENSIFRVSQGAEEVQPSGPPAVGSAEAPPEEAQPRRLDDPLHADQVQLGDEIPALRKSITVPMMVFYAAATWDFHRYHYDQAFVKERGFPQPFVDGQNLGSFLAQMLTDWCGDPGAIAKLGFRFRNFVFAGDVLTCRGRVTGKTPADGGEDVECELWIDKDDGSSALSPGTATVRLPYR